MWGSDDNDVNDALAADSVVCRAADPSPSPKRILLGVLIRLSVLIIEPPV